MDLYELEGESLNGFEIGRTYRSGIFTEDTVLGFVTRLGEYSERWGRWLDRGTDVIVVRRWPHALGSPHEERCSYGALVPNRFRQVEAG